MYFILKSSDKDHVDWKNAVATQNLTAVPARLGTAYRAELMNWLGIYALEGNAVLDLGANDGYICGNMKGFATRMSLDPSPPPILRSPLVNHVRSLGEALPIISGSVDVILCFDVLEHVEDEVPFLQEIMRVMSPNGRCILTTPSKEIRVFPSASQTWLNRRWGHTMRSGYTPTELSRLVVKAGEELHNIMELGSPLLRLFYFPLRFAWRLSPRRTRVLVALIQALDYRFHNIGRSQGYVFCEFGRGQDPSRGNAPLTGMVASHSSYRLGRDSASPYPFGSTR